MLLPPQPARASTATQQRDVVDAVSELEPAPQRDVVDDPEIDTRIAPVRDGVPDADQRAGADGHLEASRRTMLDLYGAKPGDGSFASNCLLARRLAERGVRFIQLYHRDWDHHGDLVKDMNICCGGDRPGDLRRCSTT